MAQNKQTDRKCWFWEVNVIQFSRQVVILCCNHNNYFTLVIKDSRNVVLKCKIERINFDKPIFVAQPQLLFRNASNHLAIIQMNEKAA